MKAAVYVATRNLYPDLAPSIKALLMHSDVEKIYLLLEDDGIGYQLPPECEIRNVGGQKWFRKDGPNYESPWTWTVLLRSLFWHLFPDLDRILSIDADAFVLKDISHLWDLDMDGYLFAGVRETTALSSPEKPYFNAGVLMQNLALLRSSGRGYEMARALRTRKWRYPDQDVANAVCGGNFLELPPEYNAGKATAPYGDPVIRHFMNERKTYRDSEIYRYYRDLPWSEVRP
jgi:lipopolysaccharide biosynthesis glycosyltransferase